MDRLFDEEYIPDHLKCKIRSGGLSGWQDWLK